VGNAIAISEEHGGNNWGFCSNDKDPDSGQDLAEYKIEVSTFNVMGAGSTSKISLKLIGDTESGFVSLSESGFEAGSVRDIIKKAASVGDIESIQLKITGQDDWLCNRIRVKAGTRFWDF
jgi:hypothetical protein